MISTSIFIRSRLRVDVLLPGILALLATWCSVPMLVVALPEPPLADTAYPIPGDAYYVSPAGNDLSDGSASHPWLTLAHAVSATPSGGTIVMRAGTYRESVTVGNKRLTLQAYPHEQVWMSGCSPVSGWISDGAQWRKDSWIYQFNHDIASQSVNPDRPMGAWPDMVFIDGQPLEQMQNRAQVTSGCFFVDYAAQQLWIGSNPDGHTVEATTLGRALDLEWGADGTIVRGIGFKQYANSDNIYGMVKANAPGLIFENDTFARAATTGMGIFGTNCVVSRCAFVDCGLDGLRGSRTHHLLVERSLFSRNNAERFLEWAAAGAKLCQADGMTVRDCVFEDNYTMGLWFDVSCWETTIIRNVFRRNTLDGVKYEISNRAIIACNLSCLNNCGIDVGAGSIDVQVFNNTMWRNRNNLKIMSDGRTFDGDPADFARGITWQTAGTIVANNLMSENDGSDAHNCDDGNSSFLFVRDYGGGSPAAMISQYDHNGYRRPNGGPPTVLVSWFSGAPTYWSNYQTLSSFQNGTGLDGGSLIIEDPAQDFFVDPDAYDFRLKSQSVALGAGRALPVGVTNALGMTVPSNPDLGALVWIDSAVVGPNRAPVADIVCSALSAAPGTSIQMDAGGSSDPDGNVMQMAWDFGDGTENTGIVCSHAYAVTGTYHITLIVTDTFGATNAAQATVSISPASPVTATITSPVDGAYTTNQFLTVSGAASSGAGITGLAVNGVAASTSNGYTNWTAGISLAGGTNLLIAVAGDANGSASVTSRVIYADSAFSSRGDGIPDQWKIQNWGWGFTNNPDSSAASDPDGDGPTNLQEYQAGTSPTSRLSRLAFSQQSFSGDDFILQWLSVAGKSYQVQYSTNLTNWIDAGSFNVANSITSTWTDTGTQTGGAAPGQVVRRFYRIRVQ